MVARSSGARGATSPTGLTGAYRSFSSTRRVPGADTLTGTFPGTLGCITGISNDDGTTMDLDEQLLDDADALVASDPSGSLRALASAGAQIRSALNAATEAGIVRLTTDGRPRAVVVASLGAARSSATC